MKQTGFTLVALMVVVMLVGIVAAFAIPGFSNTIKNHQMRSTADNYYALIRYARAEAVRSGRPVTVTPKENDDWATGIIASNQAGDVLREVGSKGALTIQEENGSDSIVFNGKGYLAAEVAFEFCDGRLVHQARRIDVLTSGFSAVKTIVGC